MLLLLCGDKKTRSQRSLRRYCCQRCAITRCSSVYEAALLDWLIGFYLQKLFGLSPHTVYDEPVAWNDFGCPGWPPFSQEWHGFGLGAGHKKSRVQPAPCLQASVHASAGRPCMRSVFSEGCFMILQSSMRNIHASNKNDIMMLLGLKMINSIQYTIIYIRIIYYINISSTIASHDLGITIECVIGNCFEVESIRQQVKFSDEVSNSDDVAGSTRWPCRGGKRQTKLMIHRWSTLHDMMYIYIYYNMKSLEKHLRFVHQKEHLTDVKTWSLHSDTSTTALWHGGYSLKQQLWTHSVWCFKCASGNASSSILRYGSSIERQFMLASWPELIWVVSVTAKALAEAVKSNEAAVPLADEHSSIHCTFNIRSTSMINAWPQVPRCCCLELDA